MQNVDVDVYVDDDDEFRCSVGSADECERMFVAVVCDGGEVGGDGDGGGDGGSGDGVVV